MPYKSKKDQAAASKRHYEANKEKVKSRSRERNKKQLVVNKEYVDKVKSNSGCVDCGETNHIVLDFDHIDGDKYKNISTMVHEYYSIDAIQKEIRSFKKYNSNAQIVIEAEMIHSVEELNKKLNRP